MTFLEKDLEDYICEHPEILGARAEVLSRQVRLPHGILDLLTTDTYWTVNVIELKAVPVKDQDLTQILRYAYDLQEILRDMSAERVFCKHNGEMSRLFRDAYADMCYGQAEERTLCPTLIVKDMPDDNFLAAAFMANVGVRQWKRENGRVTIGKFLFPKNKAAQTDIPYDTQDKIDDTLMWGAWRRVVIQKKATRQ